MSVLTKLTAKLHLRESESGKAYLFWCPACQCCHVAYTENSSKPNWSFNGNINSPSFSPSLRITAPPSDYCCHFILTDGKINYCSDCNHDLKGTTVDMVPIPESYGT